MGMASGAAMIPPASSGKTIAGFSHAPARGKTDLSIQMAPPARSIAYAGAR